MSLLSFEYYPRSLFASNTGSNNNDWSEWSDWFGRPLSSAITQMPLSRLEMFDPFDEIDNMITQNLRWLSRPEFLVDLPLKPIVPQKYRISCECAGFSPESIKTELKENKLIVSGLEEVKKEEEDGDFVKREFRRTFTLPETAQSDKMASFMVGNTLVIEFPLKETQKCKDADLLPTTVDNPDGTRSVQMKFWVPEGLDPKKVRVSLKDRDLIVRIEDKVTKPDGSSRFHYYQRTTLPENTKFSELKCIQENNVITAVAPVGEELTRTARKVPVEAKESTQAQVKQKQQQEQQQQPKEKPRIKS